MAGVGTKWDERRERALRADYAVLVDGVMRQFDVRAMPGLSDRLVALLMTVRRNSELRDGLEVGPGDEDAADSCVETAAP